MVRNQLLPRPRLAIIDALRAVGALTVFFVHSAGLLAVTLKADPRSIAAPFVAVCSYGNLGVDLFFVLSGFVIAYSIADDRVTLAYAGRFVVRRSLRLDPPYWCAIGLGIAWIAFRQRWGNQPEPMPTASELAAHLLYLQNILGLGQVVVVFWTLCLEVQLYLGFIGLLILARHWPAWARVDRGHAGASVTLCAFVVSLAWPLGVFGGPVHYPPGVFLAWFAPSAFKFLAGAGVAYVALGRLQAQWMAGVLGLLAVVWISDGFQLPALVTLGTAALLLFGARGRGLETWLRWRPLLFMGMLSYSFYLTHTSVIGFTIALQKRSGLTGLGASAGFIVLAFAGSLALAWALYVLVERPSMRLARRVGKAAPVVAVQPARQAA